MHYHEPNLQEEPPWEVCVKFSLCKTVFVGTIAALSILGQDRGTIIGTVTDGSGGAVPQAAVTLRNPGINITQNALTDAQGNYTFIYLSAGKYELSVEKPGFRKADVAEVVVNVNTT